MIALGVVLVAAVCLATAPASAASAVALRGLDKITGVTRDFTAPIGKRVQFGTLNVLARTCVKRPPEEPPEVSAYLEVFDTPVPDADKPKPAEESKIFSGWMFWSSPALNALQHPSYDVWVMDCKS